MAVGKFLFLLMAEWMDVRIFFIFSLFHAHLPHDLFYRGFDSPLKLSFIFYFI